MCLNEASPDVLHSRFSLGLTAVNKTRLYSALLTRARWKQKRVCNDAFCLAGREGFEPSVDTRPTTVFETVPFNHSGTSPGGVMFQDLKHRVRLIAARL